jgi:hypothetical protein
METPVKLWENTQVLARDEPYRKPFRLYFGLAYITLGITIIVYMGNR